MKSYTLSIIAVALLIGGGILLIRGGRSGTQGTANNIEMVGGKQVIEINAKGGYSPTITSAKAQTPTVLKVKTQNTFDCSAALTIPGLNYRANLKPTGVAQIDIQPQKPGTTLQGICAMGMYNFQITFN